MYDDMSLFCLKAAERPTVRYLVFFHPYYFVPAKPDQFGFQVGKSRFVATAAGVIGPLM